jgi:hypothetical protein
MVKRVYSKPKILRVLLTHEQAVLSACVVSGGLAHQNPAGRCKATVTTCRGHNTNPGNLGASS